MESPPVSEIKKEPKHYLDKEATESMGDASEYKVYTRRWFIAWSLAIGYAMWNWQGNRHVILAEAYGKYYDQPFQFSLFSASGDPGIDFLTIFSNAVLICTYIPCAVLVDKFGIRMMWVGNGMLALSTWIWYFAGNDFNGAIIAILVGSSFGPLMSTSLLATSNKWFAEKERGRATALVTITSLLGAGLSVLGPTLLGIELSEDKIDTSLKSCQVTPTLLATNETFCSQFAEAVDNFCCAPDANIPLYDLLLAVFSTLSALFTIAAVRDRPPTPPSGGADAPNLPRVVSGFKHIFSYPKHQNFIFVMISDFLVGGPAKVVFATIARILPPAVAELDVIATALGFILVLPTVALLSYLLDYRKLYYPVVRFAFTFGFGAFILLAICLAVDTVAGQYAFLAILILAVVAVLAWQVGVFELKLEYVYTEKFSVEGLVIGTDRFVVNLGSVVFLSFLAPETVGRNNVFYIGSAIMAVGLIPLYVMNGKEEYKRLEYEKSKETSVITDQPFEGVSN